MRLRFVLPVCAGLISSGLMVWDLHNQEIVSTWALDGGRVPTWPYRTPPILLTALNAPAYCLGFPLLRSLEMRAPIAGHVAFLGFILFWWWWIGKRLDFGIFSPLSGPPAYVTGTVLAIDAAILFFFAQKDSADLGWLRHLPFDAERALQEVKPLGFAAWWMLLGAGCAWAAVKIFRNAPTSVPAKSGIGRTLTTLAFSLSLLLLVALRVWAVAPDCEPPRYPWRSFSTLTGSLTDEAGTPLKHALVEILPVEESMRRRGYQITFTDQTGRYIFERLQRSSYFVAVNHDHDPDVDSPYQTVIYPGVAVEKEATRIEVDGKTPVILKPLKAKLIQLAKIEVEVLWPSHEPVESSDVIRSNRSFSGGDQGLSIENGKGDILLAVGFEYWVRASVDCDAGKQIQSRQSPVYAIKVGGGSTPRKLTFIIPWPPCTIWHPR